MTTEECAREMLRAFNANDWEAFRGLLDDDFVYREHAMHHEAAGADAAMDVIRPWKDLLGKEHHGDLRRLIVTGDAAVMEVVWHGRHIGPLTLPDGTVVPPTGAAIDTPACMVMTARDGSLVEMDHYFDSTDVLVGAGVMPART